MTRRFAVAMLGFAAAVALAASPWPEEPAHMFGIGIGKPFPAPGEIADCPLFEPFRRENLPDDLCVDTRKGVSADSIALKFVPLGGVTGEGDVTLHDGLVRAIRVSFDRRHYADARAFLLDRYGPAHSRSGDEAGETLGWTGARVTMALRENGERGRASFEIREARAP